MNPASNPVRELEFQMTVPGNHGSTNGNAVDLSAFVGPVSVVAMAGATLGSTKTITFEGAVEDPSNPGTPLGSSWATLKKGGFGESVQDLSIVLDPASAEYVADGQLIKRETVRCPTQFLRAVLSATGAMLTVMVIGKARVVSEN